MIKNEKVSNFINNTILILSTIGFLSLILRLYYFPWDIPIILDGLTYFTYAIDTSILHSLPTGYYFPNNGWPLFLSGFFSIIQSSNFLDYMMLQRYLSILISILTIIPVYFLCKRFFDRSYAILGTIFFVFEPRIIQNSLLGITEPLFIMLVTIALGLFLSSNKKIVYVSFITIGLASLIRYEGVLLIIPFAIMFFIRYRKEPKISINFILVIGIFILTLLPMAIMRIEITGQDGLMSHVVAGADITGILIMDKSNNSTNIVLNAFSDLFKYLVLVLVPTFIIFVPYGVLQFLKNKDFKHHMLFFMTIILLIPAFYAYFRSIQDTRYLYILFPIFCIVSLYTIQKIENKIGRKKLVFIIITTIIISTSIVYLNYKLTDYTHEREAYEIAKEISKYSVINNHFPESGYVRVVEFEKDFPVLINGKNLGPVLLSTEGFDNLEHFIIENKQNKIQYITVDENEDETKFLYDIFHNEQNYTYLTKVYDSKEKNFDYHVKIFEIDFDKFKMNSEKEIIPHN